MLEIFIYFMVFIGQTNGQPIHNDKDATSIPSKNEFWKQLETSNFWHRNSSGTNQPTGITILSPQQSSDATTHKDNGSNQPNSVKPVPLGTKVSVHTPHKLVDTQVDLFGVRRNTQEEPIALGNVVHIDIPGEHGNTGKTAIVHAGHSPHTNDHKHVDSNEPPVWNDLTAKKHKHSQEGPIALGNVVHIDLPGEHGNTRKTAIVHAGHSPHTNNHKHVDSNEPPVWNDLNATKHEHSQEGPIALGNVVHIDLPGEHGNTGKTAIVHAGRSPHTNNHRHIDTQEPPALNDLTPSTHVHNQDEPPVWNNPTAVTTADSKPVASKHVPNQEEKVKLAVVNIEDTGRPSLKPVNKNTNPHSAQGNNQDPPIWHDPTGTKHAHNQGEPPVWNGLSFSTKPPVLNDHTVITNEQTNLKGHGHSEVPTDSLSTGKHVVDAVPPFVPSFRPKPTPNRTREGTLGGILRLPTLRRPLPNSNMPFEHFFTESQRIRGQPWTSQSFRGTPRTSHNFRGTPHTSHSFQGTPRTSHNFQETFWTSQSFRGTPQTFESFRRTPHTVESFRWSPQTEESFRGSPQALDRFRGSPQTLSRFRGSPQALDRFRGSPQTLDRFSGSPKTLERFHGIPQPLERFHETPQTLERFRGTPQTLERFRGTPQKLESFRRTPQSSQTFRTISAEQPGHVEHAQGGRRSDRRVGRRDGPRGGERGGMGRSERTGSKKGGLNMLQEIVGDVVRNVQEGNTSDVIDMLGAALNI